jgi:SPP1 gp7 family putative phage head morphogenesis protein
MKFKQRASLAFAAITGKSLSGFAAAFVRGDDVSGYSANRLVNPYEQSAWIYSAVNLIASEVSGRPLKFYNGDTEYTDKAFLDWWAKPALGTKTDAGTRARLPIADVLFDLSAWAKLEGETFLCFDDSWAVANLRGQKPSAFTPFLIANPQRMQLITSGNTLTGYRYTDAGGQQILLLPEQVYHWKAFNPYNDWRGLGALDPARVAAEGAYLTGTYIRDLMRNNGDQGAVVIGKSGIIDDPQREQIVAALRAKREALKRGIAKDIFLTGDITVDRPKEQAASADLSSSKSLSHEEIYIAFGVPPSMAAAKSSYSLGKDSDRHQLITGTCMPVGGKIASAFGEIGSRMSGLTLTAELDWDDHPVMVEVRYSRIESGLKLWAVGMPMKAANDYLDLGMKPFAGWDKGYLPFSVVPTEGGDLPDEPTKDPALAEKPAEETPDDPAVAQLRLTLLARQRVMQPVCAAVAKKSADADPFAIFQCCQHGAPGVAQKARSAAEVARWRSYMTQRREVLRGYESRFNAELMKARRETLANLNKVRASQDLAEKYPATQGKAPVTKATAADIMFDLAKFTDALFASFRKQDKVALAKAGQQLFAEIGQDDPFAFPPEEVLEYMRARENKLSDVPQEVFNQLKESLEEGVTGGETTDQLADRVRSTFNDISKERARTIASTETAAAYGAGREEAMRSAGVEYKEWLTSGNDNVRATHAAANNQRVPIDEPFEVGGEELMYPGDSNGSAENVINCHCVSVPKEKPADE